MVAAHDPGMAAIRGTSDLAEYVQAVRRFSRNARLYMVHIVGMDMIHGTWDVLFNLYLLALFELTYGVVLFGQHVHAIEFVGMRLVAGAVASGMGSLPAGLLSDRIGRRRFRLKVQADLLAHFAERSG